MIKKTVTYKDFNGNERTEDFYFHLSPAELAEMELTTKGGFATRLQGLVDAKDVPELVKAFKALVLDSYGEKDADGRRFLKTPEIRLDFASTNAYSTLFMNLATDDKEAAEFINGLLPAEMVEEAKNQGRAVPQDFKKKEVTTVKTEVVPDPVELTGDEAEAAKLNMTLPEYLEYKAWRESQAKPAQS